MITLHSRSFVALSQIILIAMALFVILAAEDVSSGAAGGPLSGIAACLGTIVLTRHIEASRIALGKSELASRIRSSPTGFPITS
ncbi:hypothetical protein [Streptomyces sp. PTY087I2]|uniref:hypothetical protein n=1 Tax=Streptomyces sp. PTY087I2 TaxID=1819298 RepID=UPI00114D199E|nr:hypothetical protein [Streptomyces sp. PTY087I2]